MKYYMNETIGNGYEKYAIKRKKSLLLIRFEDKDIPDFLEIVRKDLEKHNKTMSKLSIVGRDNISYFLNIETGELTKVDKGKLLRFFHQFNSIAKSLSKAIAKCKHIEETYDKDTLIEHESDKIEFKKYTFIDRENTRSVAFRLRESTSKEKVPLFIFFHGGGAAGDDNLSQIKKIDQSILDLPKDNSHLLFPQSDIEFLPSEKWTHRHAMSVRKLIDVLSERIQIDYERIYLVGGSFGGACVWRALYDNPHFFAGAIPLMGYFTLQKSNTLQIENFENDNIWIGHAENDKVVPIDDDNAMYEKLSKINCNVKITRYPKYGHRMYSVFLKKEPWAEWLMEQRLTKLSSQ